MDRHTTSSTELLTCNFRFIRLTTVFKDCILLYTFYLEIDSDNPKKEKLDCNTDELEKVNEIFNKMKNISDKISSL